MLRLKHQHREREAQRVAMLKIRDDKRVPMRQIYDLYPQETG